jgi:tRNA threonylcarbamoyl adenosine modification protein YjeE
VGAAVRAAGVLALRGDLGAGKSVLARAIARGAGVERAPMPSPTFNLVFRYELPGGSRCAHGPVPAGAPDEVWELGWRELGAPDEIVLVEWPERAAALLPPDRWDIELEHARRSRAP